MPEKLLKILFILVFLAMLGFVIHAALLRKGYCVNESEFRVQLEQTINKLKKDTPVRITCWDGTIFQIIFVENPKDTQPDIILVRVWGKVLPMEKVLIKEITKRQ